LPLGSIGSWPFCGIKTPARATATQSPATSALRPDPRWT
jgi:hypothetical protein